MTEGPPSSAASSSKMPSQSIQNQPSTTSLSSPPLVSHSNGTTIPQPYANYANWNAAWSNGYAGYTAPTSTMSGLTTLSSSNPYAAHVLQSHAYSATQSPQKAYYKPTSNYSANAKPPKAHLPTPEPQPLDAKTSQNWDQAVKKFLVKIKMTEALKGFENDMLVLNPEWEQKVIPVALKEIVNDFQAILRRMTENKMNTPNDMSMNPDTAVDITSTDDRSLDERKLEYIQVPSGTSPKTQSSVNKSISHFLARTRARNDASNRAEFLKTLAEKRRDLGEKGADEGNITSCARVDAKQIDRDKQIKYDIAKYGEGPLIKMTKPKNDISKSSVALDVIQAPAAPPPAEEVPSTQDPVFIESQRKRKLILDSDEEELAEASEPARKRKGKGKKKEKDDARQAERKLDEEATSKATSEKHPGLDERITNVETHLALRYVPTPPRTLLARLKFIEDHIVKLEKEYPPWAALHFNQPNRGWPPPPRATPVIVPPHLRTFASTSTVPPSAISSSYSPTTTSSAPTSSAAGSSSATTSTAVKPRKGNSSLHKAVLERLEVQKARSEMGGKGSRE